MPLDIKYDETSGIQSLEFEEGAEYYLSAVLSNCTYNSSVWVSDLNSLSADIRAEFADITNLEFRGIGANMVRGNHNSLTIGIGASFYTAKENLTQSDAIQLRTAVRNGVLNISGLSYSEIRIEVTFVQSSTF